MDANLLIDLLIIAVLWLGVWRFKTPPGARMGNLLAALALLCAAVVVLIRHPVLTPALVAGAFVVGGAVGWIVAMRVNMLQIPAMVAFQHGAGGVAVVLVSCVELTRDAAGLPPIGVFSGLLGVIIGSATFSGSMIASGKLANRLKQTPTLLPGHSALLLANLLVVIALAVPAAIVAGPVKVYLLIALAAASVSLGVVFSIRIGGADMPVLISFLNATAGLAAAFCGIIIENRLLIACGATVAASGSILTHVMCKAMNRDLWKLLGGSSVKPAAKRLKTAAAPLPQSAETHQPADAGDQRDPMDRAIEAARAAAKVIIVPGYGMALAHAQFETVKLAETLKKMGKDVKFAIHPIAGRMPGHMHVLLAEANANSNLLFDMDDVNDEFARTDFVVVVGACDVVNPAANAAEDTPISGMPILLVNEAKHVAVCNLDARPGYSGVENPLYENPNTILLFGDAKATLARLLEMLA